MKKRLLAAIMSLCMIVSLLPVSALAVEDRAWPWDSDKTREAYFYVVDPNKSTEPTDSRKTEDFDFIGQGTVGGGIPAAWEPQVKDQTIGVSDSQASGWTYTAPTTSSSITYQGKNYQYWDGTDTKPTVNYYTVHWYRYSSANGYTDANDDRQEVGYCWHMDGYVEFSDMWNVQFKVQFPGSTEFVPVTENGAAGNEQSIWYVGNDTAFDSITKPTMETKEGYKFKGWYTDSSCTTEVQDDKKITANTEFYGKYVSAYPEQSVYVYAKVEGSGENGALTDNDRTYLQEVLGLTANGGGYCPLGTLDKVELPPANESTKLENVYKTYESNVKEALDAENNFTPYTGTQNIAGLLDSIDWNNLATNEGAEGFENAPNPCWHLDGTLTLNLSDITVTPADITIYTGGTGYEGIVGTDENGDATEVEDTEGTGLPEPGYYITLPKTLNDALLEQLQKEPGTVLDLSDYVTFTYSNNGETKTWSLERYDPNGTSQANGKYVYRLVAGEKQDPVRLLITGDTVDEPVISDQFDISLNSALFLKYDMTIYSGDVNNGLVKLTVKNDTTLGDLAGTSYTVEVKSGKLTIRGTTAEAQQATVGTETQNGFSADVALPEGSEDQTVEYYVNGSEIQVQNGDIHLLVDSLVTEENNGDQAVVNAIQGNVQEALKEDHPENAAYDMRYLNLVDNNNGNAYVTTNGETTVTWPIPDDAAEGSTFHVVHFKDLDREFNGSEAVNKINTAQTEVLEATVDGDTIKFTTSSFSPFVLVYTEKASTPPTPTPTTHTITATAGTGGSISPSGAVTVNEGNSQTFTITPASGYAISDVKVDGVSVGAVSSYTFSNVTKDHTISASFYWVGTGGGSGSGGSHDSDDSDPTGNLSIELDVNGGDDEFTFTVILTDRDGDDLENNFYYNGDYTGTIGSGDEITLEGGDKIVIRNLPEGTRYEVIIETADGYTYVIDGEEGVIHTGMNEAEFTATRTVPVADPSVTGVSRWLNTTDHIAYLTGYPGGAFGPDNNMTRAEVAQMFYALLNNKNVTITKTFPDVPADAWYATAVNTLASLGMVSGDENGNYRPNDPITRAEFCVIALAFAYEPENAVCYFGDVSRSDWFYTYVAQAASYGWIGGYTNGNFGPNDRITRAQVTTIVNNMLGRAADRDYVIDHQADLVQFTDLTRAHWGYFQIMEATNAHNYTKSNGTESWR